MSSSNLTTGGYLFKEIMSSMYYKLYFINQNNMINTKRNASNTLLIKIFARAFS